MGLLNCKKRKKETENSSPDNNESQIVINYGANSGATSHETTSSTNNTRDNVHLKICKKKGNKNQIKKRKN